MFIREEAVDKVGPFDESFGPGNFEDDDYCLRMRQAGYRLRIARDAFVFHYGSRTFLGMGIVGDQWDQLMTANQRSFVRKWGLETPERKEYLIESYVRKTMWSRMAIEFLFSKFLIDVFENTFIKPNGELYIEVHHIIPLCQGGEDGLWNLAVLCAHHHKMAHFARPVDANRVREYLLRIVGDKYERIDAT